MLHLYPYTRRKIGKSVRTTEEYTLVLLERLQLVIEPQLSEAQCGFRKGRGTVD